MNMNVCVALAINVTRSHCHPYIASGLVFRTVGRSVIGER